MLASSEPDRAHVGYCAATVDGARCSPRSRQGSLPLRKMAFCIEFCVACQRCHFVSHGTDGDCSWFNTCNMSQLMRTYPRGAPAGLKHTTVRVRHGDGSLTQRAARLPTRREVRVFLTHIPKTAGTSLERELRSHGLLVSGSEACHAKLLKRRQRARALAAPGGALLPATMLREPRRHVASMFMHCMSQAWAWGRAKQNRPPFVPAGSAGDAGSADEAGLGAWLAHFLALKQAAPPGRASTPDWRDGPFGCYDPRSLQTRFLSALCRPDVAVLAHRHYHPLTSNASDAIDVATRRSGEDGGVHVLGLTELYHESTCLLLHAAHRALPSWCSCAPGAPSPSHEQQVHFSRRFGQRTFQPSVASRSAAPLNLSRATLRRLDKLTAADARLYRAGARRVLADIARVERLTGTRFLCFDPRPVLGMDSWSDDTEAGGRIKRQ